MVCRGQATRQAGRGGEVRLGSADQEAFDTPHPNPSPEGEGLKNVSIHRLVGISRLIECQGQPAILKFAIRVFQLKLPFALIYSLVNQKVQSSTGSTTIAA